MAHEAATRAPRGTKTLVQAFFSAADDTPPAQRPEIVKAALAIIREQLAAKAAKKKTAVTKGPLPKKTPRTKVVAKAPKKTIVVLKAAKKPRARKPRPAHQIAEAAD